MPALFDFKNLSSRALSVVVLVFAARWSLSGAFKRECMAYSRGTAERCTDAHIPINCSNAGHHSIFKGKSF